jgi:hypothetical protein
LKEFCAKNRGRNLGLDKDLGVYIILSMRYYTNKGTWKHGLIIDRVQEVFGLFWHPKKKKHCFINLMYLKLYEAHYATEVTPVVFECEEHEKEFLLYHPDAACMRKFYKYGYFYACTPWGINEEQVPFEYRKGRWCWKKPLTVA